MSSQTPNWRQKLHFSEDESFYLQDDGVADPGQINHFPSPTIYVSAEFCDRAQVRLKIGEIIYATNADKTSWSIYVVKDYNFETGYFKLEWPD